MTQHHHRPRENGRRRLHKDRRVRAGLVPMPAAIAIYVLTLDDSLLSLNVVGTFG